VSYVQIKSFQYQGLEKKEISIQGIKTRGISQLSLSGNLSGSLRDSRDKIKAVVARLTSWGPVDKILLNLLPADLSKFSPLLELPMSLVSLALLWPEDLNSDQRERLSNFVYVGRISLSGELSEGEMFCSNGFSKLSSFRTLEEVWTFVISGELPLNEPLVQKKYFKAEIPKAEQREFEKFFMQIAADAKLPVLLVGPPGTGKSHLARWALGCLPLPQKTLREEVDRIWTLAGQEILPELPFQNPHSRAHLSEFVGVARHEVPRPGIFSLAHGGLLVLDEFPELARDSREILRNILDEKKVVKNTKAGFCTWPADFWLIMTANPCPCGFARGRDLSRCRCQENHRQKYLARFSGPLLDRVGVKFFLCEKNNVLSRELKIRQTLSANVPDFKSRQSLSPREKFIYDKLWRSFAARVEVDANAAQFFETFIERQKNFSKDWLVHVYE
jgi:magnesium chelatase family protein